MVDRASLISSFSAGLYFVPLHLRDPLRIISEHLLDQAISANEVVSADGVGAFQLLPGLIEYSSRDKGSVLSPAQLVAGITASGNISFEIFRIASSWQTTIRSRPPLDHTRPLNPEITRARIEALSKVGRLCKKLDAHLKGESYLPPPPPSALLQLIADLHPEDNHRDVLPHESLDPLIDTSIQITPHQLRDRIYRLSRDSSSGQTGWSYAALKDIADDRRDPGFNALTTLRPFFTTPSRSFVIRCFAVRYMALHVTCWLQPDSIWFQRTVINTAPYVLSVLSADCLVLLPLILLAR